MTERGGPEDDAAAFVRPPGVEGGYAPRAEPPAYTPPPPTVSPAEAAVFGRPDGAGAFAAPPSDRIAPAHRNPMPVPRIYSEAFGPSPGAVEGYDPPPGRGWRRS